MHNLPAYTLRRPRHSALVSQLRYSTLYSYPCPRGHDPRLDVESPPRPRAALNPRSHLHLHDAAPAALHAAPLAARPHSHSQPPACPLGSAFNLAPLEYASTPRTFLDLLTARPADCLAPRPRPRSCSLVANLQCIYIEAELSHTRQSTPVSPP